MKDIQLRFSDSKVFHSLTSYSFFLHGFLGSTKFYVSVTFWVLRINSDVRSRHEPSCAPSTGSSHALFYLVKSCWTPCLGIVFLCLIKRDSIWGLVRSARVMLRSLNPKGLPSNPEDNTHRGLSSPSQSTFKDCLLTWRIDSHRGLPPTTPPSLYNTTDLPNWKAPATSHGL